ncbi:isocitrate dehydrogenase [NAD] subunit alpha, mitochondrial [Drosophila nasuta]|uniref:isocitrate dehydrogenase [NAD] subunit alpha, mitochondrial n=1 Tax=Drosophila nasuta TaxID=42062 RepID=UPI00295EFAC3|nr:isocitrate dehydrogenase [NAD] subunit alpha, mitochondrial [Drosophila nasuta]
MNNLRNLRVGRAPFGQWLRCYTKGCDESKKCTKLRSKSMCGDQQKKDQPKKNQPKGNPKKTDQPKGVQQKKANKKETNNEVKKITLIEGQGVGCELIQSLKTVFDAAKVPIEWESFPDEPSSHKVSKELLDSLRRNKVGIKGPIEDPLWMKDLRKQFDLFAYTAVCRNMEGQDNPYGKLNCVIIRDMMEGEYSGIEHDVVPGVLQSIKISTAAGAERIAKYVFDYANEFDRKKITVAHKANIMRMTDGNFLKHMRKEAIKHMPDRLFEERYMDTACLNLIMKPETNDVLVSSSMYGDVLVMMASSITGSKAMCPGYGVSPHGRLYDTLNKVGEEVAGKDQINPTGMLFSGVLMLRRIGLIDQAMSISCAIKSVYKDTDMRTKDIGGKAKCSEFTKAVCDFIAKQ